MTPEEEDPTAMAIGSRHKKLIMCIDCFLRYAFKQTDRRTDMLITIQRCAPVGERSTVIL